MSDDVSSAATDRLLGGLNPEQRRAVTARDVPLLVLAGAGSGKTRVLTHRIALLLEEGRARPDGVLALTFTNKAAKVMLERLEHLLGGSPHGMWVGTFHAISARLLRERGKPIGVPQDFVIYDEVDRKAAIREVMKSAQMDEKRVSASSVAAEISRAKNDMEGPERYAAEAEGYFRMQVAALYPRYEALLQKGRALDFDDLLLRAVDLLQDSPEARAHYQVRFTHILVDEYQDTNRAQYLILKALADRHRHITVVGDPDQSIYGWRGADIRNILDFEEEYPDAVTVPLEQNYRSTKRILAGAQAIIAENTERLDKSLWTAGADGQPVVVMRFPDERDEARAVAGEVIRLVERGAFALGDVAILYRTNAQSRALEETLLRWKIPYRLVGGVRFYQRKEVKDVLAYLRVLTCPEDRVPFERVVNVPRRGVGVQSIRELLRQADETGRTFWDLMGFPAEAGIRGAAATGLKYFKAVMDELSQDAAGLPLAKVFDLVTERTGYQKYLRDGSPEGEERWANVVELRGLAAERGNTPSAEALPSFLEQVALAGEVDEMEDGAQAVTLITLHQVKGMEFPVVFLTGVEDGLLPHTRSMDTVSEVEEERRLLYVGMTRAKERLYLTHCLQRHVYGSPTRAIPSRFLDPLNEMIGVVRQDLIVDPAEVRSW